MSDAAQAIGNSAGAASIGVTAALARWVSELTLAAVPEEVVAHAKLCVLDALGCGLYGATQPWGAIAGDVAVGFSGGGPSSLFGRPERVSPADAALANGTAVHGFEIDDIHVSSSLHPGAVVVPASLAAAEQLGATGEDFVVSIIAGYEAGIRVGICAGTSHSTSGYHVTGTVGAVAAAAAAARVLRLSPDQTTHALAIGATQAAGLYAARMGAMAKRFHAGRAAQSGVVAAYLAAKGFTGSPEALEAPFGGFMSTLRGQFDAATILTGLGECWETARVGFKAYAACASAHTAIDALHDLMGRGLTADNLERLTIHMSKKGKTNVGWPYQPGEIVSAQMNGYYTAAVKLVDGEAFIDQYRQERLADPRILALIPRIEILHDPELDRAGAAKRHAVKMDAVLKDGTKLNSYVEQRRGSAEHPLSRSEIEQKFRRLATMVLADECADEIVSILSRLEIQPSVQSLTELVSIRRAARSTLLRA